MGEVTGDYSVIVNEVIGKLTLLNKLYFKSPPNRDNNLTNFPIFGGPFYAKDKTYDILINENKPPAYAIEQLLSLNKFDSYSIVQTSFIKPKATLTDVNIYTYTPPLSDIPTEYTGRDLSSIKDLLNLGSINEINCLGLLDYSGDFTNKAQYKSIEKLRERYIVLQSPKNTIYNFMQGLYTLYNLFDANNWQTYLSSIENNTYESVSFKIPTIYINIEKNKIVTSVLSNTTNAVTVDTKNLNTYIKYVDPTGTLLSTILESTTFNPFVARRIIYLWISLCNYFISIVLLKNRANDTYKTQLLHLVKLAYNIIVQSNQSVSYNSFQNSYNIKRDLAGDALTTEQYKIELVMFKASINFIQNVSSNPYNNYNTLIGNDNNLLKNYYTSLIEEKDNSGKFKYPTLQKNKTAEADKTAVITAVTAALTILGITSADSTLKEFNTNHQNNELVPSKNYSTFITTLTDNIYSNNSAARELGSSIGVFGDINNAVGEYISNYTDVQNEVNNISDLLQSGKTNLTTIQTLLNGRLSIQKTQQIYEYFAITIFVVFGVAAVSIMILDIDKNRKLYACIGLIIFALLNFLGIQILLNSSIFMVTAPSKPIIESFAGEVTDPAIVAALQNVGNDSYINYYNISAMDQVSIYLDNTFTLVTLLETYKAYGNMNTSMEKEVDYYNNIVSQLNNAQYKINRIYFASYINTIDISALLQLFQILTIIVAAFCTGFVLTDSDQLMFLRTWINVIACILAVIAIVIYLLEIKSRVRTNPAKVYWGNPKKKVES